MFKKEKGKKESKKQESSIVTKESLCATCVVFAFLTLLTLCSKSLIFGSVGETVHACLTGLFGYFAYPICVGILYLSALGLVGKRLVKNRRLGTSIWLCVIFAGLLVQTAMTYSWPLEGYIKKCFLAGTTFPNTTACGVFGGVVIYLAVKFLSKLGAIVLFSVLTAFFACMCYIVSRKPVQVEVSEGAQANESKAVEEQVEDAVQTTVQEAEDGYGTPGIPQRPMVALGGDSTPATIETAYATQEGQEPAYGSREFLFGGTPAENYQRNLIFNPNARVNRRGEEDSIVNTPERESVYVPSYSDSYETAVNMQQPVSPVVIREDTPNEYNTPAYTEPQPPVAPSYEIEKSYLDTSYDQPPTESYLDSREDVDEGRTSIEYDRDTNRDDTQYTREETPAIVEKPIVEEKPYERHQYMDLFSPANPRVFGENEDSRESVYEERGSSREVYEERDSEVPSREMEERDGSRLLDDEDDPYTLRTEYDEDERYTRDTRDVAETRGRGEEISTPIPEVREETRGRGMEEEPPKPVEELKAIEPPKPRVIKPYKRVPLDDFDCRDIEPSANQEEVEYTKENILATLEEFRITGATIASVTFGPTVTCYNLILPRNIAPRKVIALDESIAISLHSNGVNIYTNYEEGGVTIEVPNKERQFVQLGCMLSGDSFVNAKCSSIMFAMGKDVANRKVYGDITKMIHMLVAGSSGSGKSVFLGSLIISLIYKYSPEELRLILIDPKKTEFVLYNNLPHLMINEIITDAGKAVQSLNWAIGEMNRRYGLFEQMSRAGTYVVNLDQYNEQLKKEDRLPKIVIIIDELADLMLAAKKEMEDRIQNLTQKARAAGIHLIVATQRPSTDVITGVIKSNLATRIAFGVATDVDSRVILDQTGAQKLLGKGDFLYTMPGINVPVRVQSAFISPEDSQKVVNYIKYNNEAYYDEEATAYINSRGGNGGTPSDPFDSGNGGDNVDPVYIEALRYVILSNSASISMIQRKCSAGYNRAGKIIEWMEDMGYISPFDGAKARKVLITKEEFESKYGPLEK